jgi:hypothetical protein
MLQARRRCHAQVALQLTARMNDFPDLPPGVTDADVDPDYETPAQRKKRIRDAWLEDQVDDRNFKD